MKLGKLEVAALLLLAQIWPNHLFSVHQRVTDLSAVKVLLVRARIFLVLKSGLQREGERPPAEMIDWTERVEKEPRIRQSRSSKF